MFRHMRRLVLTAAVAAGPGLFAAQAADACQPSYTLSSNESLFAIAEANLGDVTKWSRIFYANPSLEDMDLMALPQGLNLTIPCPEGSVTTAPDPTPLQQEDAEMVLITGSNYAPFTDKEWPGQGMLVELVNAALEQSPAPVPYKIEWDDDWGRQMDRLTNKDVDMGFPWFRPDCERTPDDHRCANFHFSSPLVDLVILLFTRAGDQITFQQDSDLHGKTLCRPAGYFTHDLDQDGREWLSKGLITLEQPPSPDDCFAMLMEGSVDAVAVNEFLGVQKMFELGLTERVVPLSRPLSIEGLHVLISKKHWRGTTHLYRFNAGLDELKKTERYNEIVSRHLALFWDQIRK